MKKITKIHILQFVFALIFFTSCANEFESAVTPPSPNDGSQTVSIQLETPNSFVAETKGLTEVQESAINDVYILAFKTEVLSYVKKASTIDNNQNVSATLISSDNPSDTYKLVILANVSYWLPSLMGSTLQGLNGATYDEIQEMLNDLSVTQPLYTSGGSIPMWGELPYEEINSSNCNFSVPLVRAIARVDVGVGATSFNPNNNLATWGGLPNFELEEVIVYKPQTGYTFIPKPDNFNDSEKKATQPTVVGSPSPIPFSYTVNDGKSIVRSIYVPEANVKMGAQGYAGDSNHTQRMAIIIKGTYENYPPSYYRLDFINSEKALTNVLRNHLYQFNIKSVSGNGFNNPEDAYKSLPTNIEVEVLEWNDGAIGSIVFDGQYMLGVNKPEFTFPRNEQTIAQTENELIVTTDVPDGWEIDQITDENGNPAGATWLTVDTHSGSANVNTTVNLLVEENKTGIQRTAFIYIVAGRLRYAVKVTQTPVAAFIPKKRLLTIGGDADGYGYNFSGTSASGRLITSIVNFGTTPISYVKTEGFEIINGGENPSEAQMYEWLVNNPVDIVVLGYANANINDKIAGYYMHFLSEEGVVLAFQEYSPAATYLIQAVLGSNVTVSAASGAGAIYRFFSIDNEILNGPFGDLRGLQWGEDASTTLRITGYNTNTIEPLSNDENITSNSGTGTERPYATAFKHKTLNFIWVGDAGFNAYHATTTSVANCPFRVDVNNFPIPRTVYGSGTYKYPVYNSTFTANALGWALKKADEKYF